MDDTKREAAIQKYCADNADADGVVWEHRLTEDAEVRVKWTDSTWEDGVPVTKLIERSSARRLFIPAGTLVRGVVFVGRASGCQIFDFPYGSTWYSARTRAAKAPFNLG